MITLQIDAASVAAAVRWLRVKGLRSRVSLPIAWMALLFIGCCSNPATAQMQTAVDQTAVDPKATKTAVGQVANQSPPVSGDQRLAAAQDPTSTTNPSQVQGKPTSKSRNFGDVLKANVKETFELDPRLKKDLTEGNPALAPIRFMQDYCAAGYNPSFTWTRTGGDGTGNTGTPTHLWTTDYQKRALALYMAGPVTKHLSGWFQMTPLNFPHHFFQHFELFQGMANYGNDDHTCSPDFWQRGAFSTGAQTLTFLHHRSIEMEIRRRPCAA